MAVALVACPVLAKPPGRQCRGVEHNKLWMLLLQFGQDLAGSVFRMVIDDYNLKTGIVLLQKGADACRYVSFFVAGRHDNRYERVFFAVGIPGKLLNRKEIYDGHEEGEQRPSQTYVYNYSYIAINPVVSN